MVINNFKDIWLMDIAEIKPIYITDESKVTRKRELMILSILDVRSHMTINAEIVNSYAPCYTISALQNAVNNYGVPSKFISYKRDCNVDNTVFDYISKLGSSGRFTFYHEKKNFYFIEKWSSILRYKLDLSTRKYYKKEDINAFILQIINEYNYTPQKDLNYYTPIFCYYT